MGSAGSRTTLCEWTRPSRGEGGPERLPGESLPCDRTMFMLSFSSNIHRITKHAARLVRGVHGFHFAGEENETSGYGFVHVHIHPLLYPKN